MKRESGFSMLEVMVSLFVIMLGVLGVAGTQLLAISNTEIARYQSLAALLASSMAAEIQGNVAYWGTAPGTITVALTGVSGGPAAGSATCISTVCTPAQMAYADLYQWSQGVGTTLPSGTAIISCPSGITPASCTLTLSWQEQNVALNNPTSTETGFLKSAASFKQQYFTMVTVQ